MPLIWPGSSALSLEAPAERGGPSSGEGAGPQSMFKGLFLLLWTLGRRPAALILAQLRRRIEETEIAVAVPTCIMLPLLSLQTAFPLPKQDLIRRNVVRYRKNMELTDSATCGGRLEVIYLGAGAGGGSHWVRACDGRDTSSHQELVWRLSWRRLL